MPNHKIAEVLYRLNIGIVIDNELLEEVFKLILTHPNVKSRDVQLGAFLTGLMVSGLTVEAVTTLIRTALNIDGLTRFKLSIPKGERLVTVAGSGKKGLKTFNISTPACIVAVAAGAYVAKPGSGATASVSGSMDFANVIGMKTLSHQDMSEVLLKTGFGLFSIEHLIPKFDGVYGGKIFGPTPLSFGLPAIVNPIVCDSLLYGLSHPNIELSMDVLKELGYEHVMVVSSSNDEIHYIDELTPLPLNLIGKIEDGVISTVESHSFSDFSNFTNCAHIDLIPGESLLENVQIAINVLDGKGPSSRESAVALNAGAILVLARKAVNIREGYEHSIDIMRSGKAMQKLEEFIDATGGSKKALNSLRRGVS